MFTSKVKSRISHSLPHCTTHTGPTDCVNHMSSHLISFHVHYRFIIIKSDTKPSHFISCLLNSNQTQIVTYFIYHHSMSDQIIFRIISFHLKSSSTTTASTECQSQCLPKYIIQYILQNSENWYLVTSAYAAAYAASKINRKHVEKYAVCDMQFGQLQVYQKM